jgi:hypothetical protein
MATDDDIDDVDLGESTVTLPAEVDDVRALLLEAVSDHDWEDVRTGMGDGELRSE